jgi:hypothetical protein
LLLIASKDPEAIIKSLREAHKFKFNVVGSVSYHLECDFFDDSDGMVCCAPRKYILKMMGDFEMMHGCKPQESTSPLE